MQPSIISALQKIVGDGYEDLRISAGVFLRRSVRSKSESKLTKTNPCVFATAY